MSNETTLGRRLRELRESSGTSLREVAREIGVSAPFLSDVELGRRFPSEDILAKLSKRLGAPLEELKRLDTRMTVSEVKRLIEATPSLSFAFKAVANRIDTGKLSPEELAAKLRELSGGRKN